jgi:hypothetical protein
LALRRQLSVVVSRRVVLYGVLVHHKPQLRLQQSRQRVLRSLQVLRLPVWVHTPRFV